MEKLKQFITSDAEALVKRLANDTYSLPEKQNHFNHEMFVYSPDSKQFSSYNPCAIYQLIDQMTRLLRIIRKTDSDFFIQVRKKLEGLKEKVYRFYRFGNTDYIWDRSVLELLDTEIHHKEVERAIDNAIAENEDWTRYESKLDDTFTRHQFYDLLAKRFLSVIEKDYENYLDEDLGTKNRNLFEYKMEKVLQQEIIESKLSLYNQAVLLRKQCELLKKSFKERFRKVSLDYIDEYAERIRHYEELADEINMQVSSRNNYGGLRNLLTIATLSRIYPSRRMNLRYSFRTTQLQRTSSNKILTRSRTERIPNTMAMNFL